MRTVLSSAVAVCLFSAALLIGIDHPLVRLVALTGVTSAAVVLGMALENLYPSTTNWKAEP